MHLSSRSQRIEEVLEKVRSSKKPEKYNLYPSEYKKVLKHNPDLIITPVEATGNNHRKALYTIKIKPE